MSNGNDRDERQQRRANYEELKSLGVDVYPGRYVRSDAVKEIVDKYSPLSGDELKESRPETITAGRIIAVRSFGKANFLVITDGRAKLQAYVRKDAISEAEFKTFGLLDVGDFVGVEGHLFRTRTDELTVWVSALTFLAKCFEPLPEKWHGLTDVEIRYRRRYLDLIVNSESRETFETRSRVMGAIRRFLDGRGYLEVETPMMQSLAGGAIARPFVTHHNAFDIPLYLRIAPELYLKRLVVGGMERVYEINRNFRNEGISTRHNPEFTMLEFYQAYSDYEDLMNLTEHMMRELTTNLFDSNEITYQEKLYDLGKPFDRMTVFESILKHNENINNDDLQSLDKIRNVAGKLDIPVEDNYGLGKIQIEIFEKTVESKLLTPTFITQFPTEVSPLARKNNNNPFVTDRFEFFIAGREIANGFSELNDPEDQAERFKKQVEEKNAGDAEAMHFDDDYIKALEYGMPPTAGEGIGIDRLVMFLTDSSSIRDVILFPHMRQK